MEFYSYFSPNLMSQVMLETLFVQREVLAKQIIESITDSVSTDSKQYSLLIGPRGIGKTHFISLIYHRLKGISLFHENAIIAWLREEEWGIGSFLDLLIRILLASLSYETHSDIAEQVDKLYELTAKDAETRAKQLLEELVGNRTLIILMENLDEIFKGLEDEGQKKLRAYLQNKPFCTILATSKSLFNGVSKQTSPFYGFFDITYLKPLDLEDATKLLINIANYNKDYHLVKFILSPTGKATIGAIHHLASGNHRVYAIFSEFLNSNGLAEPFIRTLDSLTPYYQSRLKDISPQQRKIIEYLCEERRAIVVKEIAQHCFMTHQTTSSQLKELKDKGYVISTTVGRESYYELQEPLMRLCIELKMRQDKPIELFVDFLRSWYLAKDLKTSSTSHSTMLKNDWEEVYKTLEKDFLEYSVEQYHLIDTTNAISILFNSTRDTAIWQNRIQDLFELFDKHKALSLLGVGLVKNIKLLSSPMTNIKTAEIWRDLWKGVAGKHDELTIGFRFLDIAVEYYESGKEQQRVLLSLPTEQREILSKLLTE